ncbi:MAG: hypothetical protein AB7V42_08840 [Thermoleophilia bacterium]
MLVGWLIVYNALRLAGRSPSGAAWISLAIGGVAGLAFFAGLALVRRRMAANGRLVARQAVEIPSPSELTRSQRTVLSLVWPALLALAAVAIVVGAYLVVDWLQTDSADRATTTIILGAWNVLVGLWLGDEAWRLRRGEADGIDSIVLGCALTAVLAGVGFSRDLVEAAQVVLIVLAGVAGTLTAVGVWFLRGGRGLPVAAVVVAVVAALSLILPLTV